MEVEWLVAGDVRDFTAPSASSAIRGTTTNVQPGTTKELAFPTSIRQINLSPAFSEFPPTRKPDTGANLPTHDFK